MLVMMAVVSWLLRLIMGEQGSQLEFKAGTKLPVFSSSSSFSRLGESLQSRSSPPTHTHPTHPPFTRSLDICLNGNFTNQHHRSQWSNLPLASMSGGPQAGGRLPPRDTAALIVHASLGLRLQRHVLSECRADNTPEIRPAYLRLSPGLSPAQGILPANKGRFSNKQGIWVCVTKDAGSLRIHY